MNTETPHTLQWGFVPYGDGKELLGSIIVRMSIVDSENARTEKEMLLQLRRSMAQVIGCPMARIAFHPVPNWADKMDVKPAPILGGCRTGKSNAPKASVKIWSDEAI